jgi:predicted transcriptional regulator
MKTVTLSVSNLEEAMDRFERGWKGEKQGARLSFATIELLWKTLTPRRWELLQAMAGKGPMSLRAAARLVKKDVKTTHGDIHTLLKSGILDRDEDGRVSFPYDAIHVDFLVKAAA